MQQNDPDPEGFADLDPPRPAPRRRRDAILLGLLLVGLLAFALADWWQQNARTAAYRAGVGATAARHWAEARADFTDAGGYSDAPALARTSEAQVARLEDGYRRMDAATKAGDLLVAWQQARAVSAIQPDYHEIAARLVEAKRALFTQGVAGLVYLQTGGSRPGLYVTGADGSASYLPGSDRRSRLHSSSPDGSRFIYDVRLADGSRRLALASLADGRTPSSVTLPADLDPGAEGLFTSGGGVWASSGGGSTQEIYDPVQASLVAAIQPPDGAVVVGALPGGPNLLLARSVPGPAGTFSTMLSLSGPADMTTAAFALPGFLLTASLSPDSRYAAVLAEEAGASITRTLYLLDLRTPGSPPRQLDQIAWQGMSTAAELRVTWLPGVPTPGLVLEHKDPGGLSILRYTLPGLARASLWAALDLFQRDERAALSADGSSLALRVQLDRLNYLAWVPITGGAAVTLPLRLIDGQLVDPVFAPRGAFLVYLVRNPDGLDRGTTDTLYSLPVPPDGTAPAFLTRVARMYNSLMPTYALPASGALAVYVAPGGGELHARTLDGAADSVLAPGVSAAWALPHK